MMLPRPPQWKGRTVFCLGSGPSLTAEDVATVRAACAPVIVTNTTFRMAPWADALMGFDFSWWRYHVAEVRETFAGRLFCQSSRGGGLRGLEWPGIFPGYRSFGNSGACAVALAIAAGAAHVVLLGYDAQRAADGAGHHHAPHPSPLRDCDTLPKWPAQFERLARWARVPITNASRETALECFPRAPLESVLLREAA